ncbi:MAG TPA: FAD/NAD(P)-binding protein [Drouetiella sp.]
MTKNTAHIAIVGGGFSGTLATVHLVKLLTETKSAAKIYLIEKTNKLAKGIAYDTHCDLHLLNVIAQEMSAFPAEKDHFINWLSKRFSAVSPSAFISRKIYGEYITEILETAIATKGEGVEIEFVSDEAVELSADEKQLILASGRAIDVDRVVLATGNFEPTAFAANSGATTSDVYVNNPWSHDALNNLSPNDNILLIGTGLTSVDVAVQLYGAGHKGIITAISRHGLLPNRHRVFNRIDGQVPAEALPSVLPTKLRELFSLVREKCDKAVCVDSDWRHVINEVRPQVQSVWKNFDITDKKRFLRHLRAHWEVVRHRIAPDVANIIDELREDYRLRIVAGRLQTITVDGNAAQVTMRLRKSGRVQTASYRRIINCTGPDLKITSTSDPLIKNLLNSQAVAADDLGLGIQLDEHGYAIKPNQMRSETILAIGNLRKGQLWETTAVPELRGQAADVAHQIVDSLFLGVVTRNAVERGITSV